MANSDRAKYGTWSSRSVDDLSQEWRRSFRDGVNPTRVTYSQIISPARPKRESKKQEKQDPPFILNFGIASLQGQRRSQEDSHYAVKGSEKPSDQQTENDLPISFFGVYDGHGGQVAAEFTSKNLFKYLVENLKTNPSADIPTILKEGFAYVEKEFIQKAEEESLSDGTTAVVAIIKDNILYVANLGDSEMVLCTEGKSEILTECHNPKKNEKELQRVEAMGGRIIKGRVGHPRLNPSIFSIAVSRAIGDSFFKDPQVTEGRPSGLIAEPYITQRLIKESDEFLVLACDGVWDVLGYQDVVDYVRENLKKEKDPQKVSEMLCQLALDKGSTDNITALIVTFRNLN